jgi:type III secretion protein D
MSTTNDLELRILNGLHRGASLPLDDQPQLIGSGDDADVVLVDPGIEPRHAVLRLDGGHWSLLALDGIVRGAADDVPADQPQLAPGDCARVGRIWLTVTAQGAPWQDPPADPPPQAAAPEAAQADVEEALEPLEPEEPEPVAAPQPVESVPARAEKPRRRRSRIVMLPVALGAGLVAAAAYAYTARSGDPVPAAATAGLKPVAVQPKAPPPSPEALRQAFRQRLAEVDLLRRFELTLDERAWTLRASLDEEEAARFRRILDAFVAAHHIDFPIDARIGGADTMLPFKVRQVVSGANASIVTDDGQRLYPGDDYKGVRLVAINGNRISFKGTQPIEVKW